MQSSKSSSHPAYRFSGLARPLDPAYPSNKAVLLFAPVAFLLGLLHAHYEGYTLAGAAEAGINAALVLFFCWALTRELSPDDSVAAFIAPAIALALWPRAGSQSILALVAVLAAARLVNRSPGRSATMFDSVLLTAGFAALAWYSSWVFGALGIMALTLDALLRPVGNQPRRRSHFVFAGLLLLATGARVLEGIDPLRWPPHLPAFATVAGLYLLAIMLYPRPRSVGDVDGRLLMHPRVRAGLVLGLLGTLLLSMDSGFSLARIASLWACMLAVPMTLPFLLARR